jgi:two-component system response regulator YesN
LSSAAPASPDRRHSLLVAEDEELIRGNLVKKIRENAPDFAVVAEADNGQAALDAVEVVHPDVVITDIRMPVLDGLGLIRELYFGHPEVKVVIVSGYDEFAYAQTAIQYGVKDYLLKPVSVGELRATLARLRVQLDAERSEFEAAHLAFPEASAQEELAAQVQEYLRARYAEEISLGDLAARFHVNPPYLARVFRRFAGVAPVRYIRELRIAAARKLLEQEPRLEIKQVADLVGYPDPGYFSRVFRQAAGMSPLEYRQRRAGGAGGPGGGGRRDGRRAEEE